jgi:hypothetical protein
VDLEGGIVAYPMYAQPPAPRPRPTTVTGSSYLLYVTAAVGLISAILSLTEISTISDVYKEAYSGTSGEGTEVFIVGSTVVGVVINILFAAGLAVLAIFNNRGRQGARITTWVLGGISLCCSGFGVAGTALTSSMNFDTGSNGPSASEVEQRLADALPSWYTPITVVLAVVSLLSILGAIILLALPSSNAYFRPVQAGWDPSMPYPQQQPPYPQPPYQQQQPPSSPYQPSSPPYPGQQGPQYPPYPGQPYPGQQQPGPAPSSGGPATPPPSSGGPAGPPPPAPPQDPSQPPHTGSLPPTDPWNPPSERPPSA